MTSSTSNAASRKRNSSVGMRPLLYTLIGLDLFGTFICWSYLVSVRADSLLLMSLAAAWVFSICFAAFLLGYMMHIRLGQDDFGPVTA